MKHLFSAIWLLLFPLLVYAQVEVVLSDSLTGERISDVAVVALETGESGISNAQGVARLSLTKGFYTVDITHLSIDVTCHGCVLHIPWHIFSYKEMIS